MSLLVHLLKKTGTISPKNDVLSGITVSLAMIPEVVAFAFVAGINPLVALSGAFMLGLITALFGGRPGLISGAAGAVAVIFVPMIIEGHARGEAMGIENLGFFYLFATVILMGIIQILAGVLKLGRYVRLIPHPVMMGFVNGLAVVIFISQIGMFKLNDRDVNGNIKVNTHSIESVFVKKDKQLIDERTGVAVYGIDENTVTDLNTNEPLFIIDNGQVFNVSTQVVSYNYHAEEGKIYSIEKHGSSKSFVGNTKLIYMILLTLLTMAIIFFLPKIAPKLPAALTAIIVVTLLVYFTKMDVSTVKSYIVDGGGNGLKGELPKLNMAFFDKLPFNLDTLKFIFPYAFLAASVGLIETLMTLNLVDEITETRGNGNKECIAQGSANIVSGLFGGTGGCAMIGQTMININAKGRGRLSGVSMALTLLSFLLFADKMIEQVPIAALVGVMVMMVIDTFAWSSFRILRKIPISDAVVLIAVSIVTVFVDLAVAVFIGVIISALAFAWENAKRIRARKSINKEGSRVYEIYGVLFFGSIQLFNEKFDIKNDPDDVIIDFLEAKVADHSGVEAIKVLAEKYENAGKTLHLKHLSPDCRELLNKAETLADIKVLEDDPHYFVVSAKFQD